MNFTYFIVGLYSAAFWGAFFGFCAAVVKFLLVGTSSRRGVTK